MNQLLATLNAQWRALPSRTRTFAVIGTVLIGILLLYTAIWVPMKRDLARLRVSVPEELGQLEWMRSQEPLAKMTRARAVTSNSALTPLIEQSAIDQNVRAYITKIEAEGNNSARVTLDAIPFNVLVAWISELQAVHGAVVDDATIEAHTTSAIVNARLRLRAGGA